MDDFSPCQLFFTHALLSEHLEQAIVAAYKPWAPLEKILPCKNPVRAL